MATYNVAAGEEVLKAKLDKQIAAGQASAMSVIERIQREMPDDKIVRTSQLVFEPGDGRMTVVSRSAKGADEQLGTLHRHAMQQLGARAEIPMAYMSTLLDHGDWGRNLLADNFNRIFEKIDSERVLTRAVNGEGQLTKRGAVVARSQEI